jgi:predicted DNA-binding transcriptional regulator AlpA
MTELAPLMNDDETAGMFGISSRHMKRLVEKGEFPAPIRLGSCVRWSRKDIEEWIAGGCARVQHKAKRKESDG